MYEKWDVFINSRTYAEPNILGLFQQLHCWKSARFANCLKNRMALRALSEIRDHRAIPVMMSSLSEESALSQYWAKEGLERLGLDMVYIKP